jgi:hypothetical protein
MATKKARRAAALEKRERFLEEERRIGLEAQEADRKRREEKARRNKEEAERLNRRMETILATHGIHESALDDGLKSALRLSRSMPLVSRKEDS